MLVYDITNPTSFEKLDSWREDFLRNVSPADPANFPFIVIGNKVDRESERRVPQQQALQWTHAKPGPPMPFFETSAKEALGGKVETAFLEIAQMALRNSANQEPEM